MIMHTDDQPRDQPGVTPPPPDGLKRYIKPAAITALLVSLVTHIILLLIAAIITFSSARGGPSDAGETIELAVMTEEEFAALEDVALDSSATEVEELPLPDTPEIEMEMSAVEADLASEAASLEATIGGGNIGDGSVGISGSGDGSARFFGVEASGTRFAYIVDVSGSMDVSGKIDTLRLELNKSIDGLLESASFFIVLYNSGASPIGGKSDWVDATDGEFDPGVEQEIARLNATYDVPIHCITFVSTQSEALMRRIAINSGGTYTHIAGPGG
jgi:hypothetical protein